MWSSRPSHLSLVAGFLGDSLPCHWWTWNREMILTWDRTPSTCVQSAIFIGSSAVVSTPVRPNVFYSWSLVSPSMSCAALAQPLANHAICSNFYPQGLVNGIKWICPNRASQNCNLIRGLMMKRWIVSAFPCWDHPKPPWICRYGRALKSSKSPQLGHWCLLRNSWYMAYGLHMAITLFWCLCHVMLQCSNLIRVII